MIFQPSIAVLGGGSFGTAIANLLAENNGHIWHWMRDQNQADTMLQTRFNPRYLTHIKIHENVIPTTDLTCVGKVNTIFIALPSYALRIALKNLNLTGKYIISLTKGIEPQTFNTMSRIMQEIAPDSKIGALSGPNLAREIAEGNLTASVIASSHDDLCHHVQSLLHCQRFRVYISNDCYGVELGGALKNVYAIIAGMADALNMGENTRSMLITRALAEMTRFAVALGANPMTFLGLAGVGDLIATCTSEKSRNFRIGKALGLGVNLKQALANLGETAEGINTLQVLKDKAEKLDIYMPLAKGLYGIIFENQQVSVVLNNLTHSDPKTEVDFISAQGF